MGQDYLSAGIARNHPEILERMKRDEKGPPPIRRRDDEEHQGGGARHITSNRRASDTEDFAEVKCPAASVRVSPNHGTTERRDDDCCRRHE
jgi:hypothetical protein